MPRRRRIVLPEARRGLDRLKYEVARDLGLADDVERRGWGDMTTREVGHIGGQMVRRMVRRAEQDMAREAGGGRQNEGGG
ncbi:MAG: alpha/beta-type small acid-soluble spore protein [Bacillota bacterium]|nr:alpha/beta-type small acid-soluble spore protein [Bacillota bacterium]MDI7248716.1 alpha/beta-type small acid-soluble spore protein [Bacillota bacterium]